MLNKGEESRVFDSAYVPEHVVSYFSSVAKMEPFLFSSYLCYVRSGWINFIGYPLGEAFDPKKMNSALESAIKKFAPENIGIIAPSLSDIRSEVCFKRDRDEYYLLELGSVKLDKKLRSILRRAGRELKVEVGNSITPAHTKLAAEFLKKHSCDEYLKSVFSGIPEYVAASEHAVVLSALNGAGSLVAFDILELGSKNYAFYQFNFFSRELYVPGASDLLLSEAVRLAIENGKRYINLGLGINEGIRKFKQKWGGKSFLDYEMCIYSYSQLKALELQELWGV